MSRREVAEAAAIREFEIQKAEAIAAAKKAVENDDWSELAKQLGREHHIEFTYSVDVPSEDRLVQTGYATDEMQHIPQHQEEHVESVRKKLLEKQGIAELLAEAARTGKSTCTERLLGMELHHILKNPAMSIEKRLQAVSDLLTKLETTVMDEHKAAWESIIASQGDRLTPYFLQAVKAISKADVIKLGEVQRYAEVCLSDADRTKVSDAIKATLLTAQDLTDRITSAKQALAAVSAEIKDPFRQQIIKILVENLEKSLEPLKMGQNPGKIEEATRLANAAIQEATASNEKGVFLERGCPPAKGILRTALADALNTLHPGMDPDEGAAAAPAASK